MEQIMWPRTDLIELSMMMRMNQPLNHLTLPTEWKEWAWEDGPRHEKSTPRGHGDRYNGPAEDQRDKRRPTPRDGGGHEDNKKGAWQAAHLDRYGWLRKNPQVSGAMKVIAGAVPSE